MSQSTFLVGSLLAGFIVWTIMRGTFPLYLSDLGLGGPAKSAASGGVTATPGNPLVGGSAGGAVDLRGGLTSAEGGLLGGILGSGAGGLQ